MLTRSQFEVLAALQKKGGQSVRELAKVTDFSVGSVAAVLK